MKKTWTAVVEITQDYEVFESIDGLWNNNTVDEFLSGCISVAIPEKISYRIMEIIEAPYGPQHPGGVFIVDSKKAHPPQRLCAHCQSNKLQFYGSDGFGSPNPTYYRCDDCGKAQNL